MVVPTRRVDVGEVLAEWEKVKGKFVGMAGYGVSDGEDDDTEDEDTEDEEEEESGLVDDVD